MKKIGNLIRKFFFSFIILYGFNTIGSNFNIIIPMNLFTLLFITCFGFFGLFSLSVLYVLIFWGDKYAWKI